MSKAGSSETSGEAYFRQLYEYASVALVATDRDLGIKAWNVAAARMFGASADRMIGARIGSIVPQESRANAEHMLLSAIDTGQTFQFEFEHRDAAGNSRELSGTIGPIASEGGMCIGASLCIRDITRRTELQDELSESRKMASLGALAGAIAHHFNNILGGVITSVDYAAAINDPAITARVLEQTGRALQRATLLISGLLAFAEGDVRAEDLSDFTEIVNSVADDTERDVVKGNIEISLEIPKIPVMPFPRMQVRTIMGNITQNALEAMPDGGKLSIEVSLEPEWILTRISDTGVGMDADAIPRVFEPFWSTKGDLVSGSTTTKGTGLGLAIAHGLVQTMGGTITVKSERGKGSCFQIRLPRQSLGEA